MYEDRWYGEDGGMDEELEDSVDAGNGTWLHATGSRWQQPAGADSGGRGRRPAAATEGGRGKLLVFGSKEGANACAAAVWAQMTRNWSNDWRPVVEEVRGLRASREGPAGATAQLWAARWALPRAHCSAALPTPCPRPQGSASSARSSPCFTSSHGAPPLLPPCLAPSRPQDTKTAKGKRVKGKRGKSSGSSPAEGGASGEDEEAVDGAALAAALAARKLTRDGRAQWACKQRFYVDPYHGGFKNVVSSTISVEVVPACLLP